MADGQRLDAATLADNLRRLDITTGDTVLVHSAIKGIGTLANGPADIVHAFQQVIGPSGLLMMPTFTYGLIPFSTQTKSFTGILTETFRNMPGVVRSSHPTHSIAAWGRNATDICDGHEHTQPFGVSSPLDRFLDANGKIFLLGVDHRSSSTIHMIEKRLGMPYLGIRNSMHRDFQPATLPDGRTIDVPINEFPGCSCAFNIVEKDLRLSGAVRDGRLGARPVIIYRAQDVLRVANALTACDCCALLCTNPDCYICSRRRAAHETSPRLEA